MLDSTSGAVRSSAIRVFVRPSRLHSTYLGAALHRPAVVHVLALAACTALVGCSIDPPGPERAERAAASTAPRVTDTSCIGLFGGLDGVLVEESDATSGCTGYGVTGGTRLYPTARTCPDGRVLLSLQDPGMERIYFGHVGEPWKSIEADPQNLALLDAARQTCSSG